MYTIREEPSHARLRITLSGRVPTDEALRAIRQASVLLRTDGLNNILCDATLVQRGPGKLMLISAFLASEFPANARLALIAGEWQWGIARRILRFSGLGKKVRSFDDEALAEDWLADLEPSFQVMTPEARHMEFFAAELARTVRGTPVEKVGPAA